MNTEKQVEDQNDNIAQQFSTAERANRFLVARSAGFLHTTNEIDVATMIDSMDIVSKEPDLAPPPPGATPVLNRRFRWVIRNDDLNLLDSVLEGVKGSASAGFFLAAGVNTPSQWGALVGLAAMVLKVVRGALNRGTQLPEDLFTVIAATKDKGPITSEELTKILLPLDSEKWNLEFVEDLLENLRAMPMNDGTVRTLVALRPDKKWIVSGI